MSGDAAELGGPDLRVAGCAVGDLADGAMVLGHAGGEPVVLARVGDAVFAVAAACTHYSGPLVEGLLVGETIRCPLHHACFNLRTGAALRAPALNPIACWDVERRDARWFVGAKRAERDPLAPVGGGIANRAPASASVGAATAMRATAPASVVIIGAGAAGSAAAEMLRREGYAGKITVIDGESDSPYDRPNLSKDYLAGNAQEEWMPLRAADFYPAHGIELLRARARSIDPQGSHVVLDDGRRLPYAALLLATGAEPVRLDIPGHDLPFVFTLRSWDDSRAIIAAAGGAQHAVVVGASFIGLEVAAALRERTLDVHVVAPETVPLSRVMGAEIGRYVRTLHEQHGVHFHLASKPARIEPGSVVLDSGASVPADLVVIGVGVRPRLDLAAQAGLAIDRGVVVNEFLETSVPGIFAAGDIARWPDPHTGTHIRVEHWVLAQRQGQTAARNILGAHERFDAVPYFWSAHYDVSVRYTGHAEQWDHVDVAGTLGDGPASVAYRAKGKTLAVASIDADRANLWAEAALEQNDDTALARPVTSTFSVG